MDITDEDLMHMALDDPDALVEYVKKLEQKLLDAQQDRAAHEKEAGEWAFRAGVAEGKLYRLDNWAAVERVGKTLSGGWIGRGITQQQAVVVDILKYLEGKDD